ncbi:MAG: acylneuraminate cytidylyltransferase family protein [Candidatus Buchananbacteria bacterium]|nr:acylneuraminate cytidylyltransferase family protein [Candidatus Buchananbacteria bacterium]
MNKVIALIPARSGSKRIPNKNIKELHGHPLIAYTIKAALNSKIFSRVIVSTDSEEIRDIALRYGAQAPFLRPKDMASDTASDIEWVSHALGELGDDLTDCFSILRPTSPFRQPETIQRAWKKFLEHPNYDSLRAIEKVSQHPGKMWRQEGDYIKPLMENPDKNDTPWHSKQYHALPEVYVQNASLEIAWTKVPLEHGTIAGEKIVPFFTEGYEGFDINKFEDWIIAEYLINNNLAQLPSIK